MSLEESSTYKVVLYPRWDNRKARYRWEGVLYYKRKDAKSWDQLGVRFGKRRMYVRWELFKIKRHHVKKNKPGPRQRVSFYNENGYGMSYDTGPG